MGIGDPCNGPEVIMPQVHGSACSPSSVIPVPVGEGPAWNVASLERGRPELVCLGPV